MSYTSASWRCSQIANWNARHARAIAAGLGCKRNWTTRSVSPVELLSYLDMTQIKRDCILYRWIDGQHAEYTLTCGHVVHGKPRQSHPPAMRCEQCEKEEQ